ncbi:hypothetical protein WJX79_005180 [Trebouxia sp. C0005]
MAGQPSAVSPQQTAEHPPGVLAKPAYYKRFFKQLWTLLYHKQARVAFRNRTSTLIRLVVAPFLFILLVYVIDKAISSGNQSIAENSLQPHTAANAISAVAPCESDLYSVPPCWDFFYSPNNSGVAEAIVAGIQANNPGRVIPNSKVMGFADRVAANNFMTLNPNKVTAAVHLDVTSAEAVGFTLQTNSTPKFFKGKYQDSLTMFELPLQVATEREIARQQYILAGQQPLSDWTVRLKDFPHPALSANSLVGQVIGPFLFAASMFSYVPVISGVVGEQEVGLRQMLRTMGMLDSAYWLSWMLFEMVMGLVLSLLLIAFGAIFQLSLFLHNSFGILFFLLFLFQLSMASFAFLCSIFVRKASTAVNLGFMVFIAGWIMQVVIIFGYPYTPQYYNEVVVGTVLFTLLPWSTFVKALQDLGDAVTGQYSGIAWQDRFSYCHNLNDAQAAALPYTTRYRDNQCVMSVGDCLLVLLALWIIFFAAAVYFSNVWPNEHGVRRRPWFFVQPGYWRPARSSRPNLRRHTSHVTSSASTHAEEGLVNGDAGETLDPDVAAEEARVQELLQHRTGANALAQQSPGGRNAVEVLGLQKVYRTSKARNWFRRLCCAWRRRPAVKDYWAIKDSWFAIENNQLFCLLGPNGAGKTTTINCLTGVIPASGGDALVYGEALSSTGGMDRIRSMMGVCPQFDVLWSELTGLEHLTIYGNIKGLPGKLVRQQSKQLLEQVRLTSAGRLRSGSYSGGMKRRLSVACALLGDPHIVFLDEPTTGMDPISRRHVWDIIETAKAGRAIVLTTHSMEEADVLGDRIAIMARGRLRCIGSSIHLKHRFGSGYQLNVSVAASSTVAAADKGALERRGQAVQGFFQDKLGLSPADNTGAYLSYHIPASQGAALPDFLQELEAVGAELGVTDLNIGLTTLEEVFLTIARKAEVEAAAQEGRSSETVYLPGGALLKVPLGEEYATVEGCGEQYQVKWAQDESGNLQILEYHPIQAPVEQGERANPTQNGGSSPARNTVLSSQDQLL